MYYVRKISINLGFLNDLFDLYKLFMINSVYYGCALRMDRWTERRTETGPPARQAPLSAAKTEHPVLERSWAPGPGHLRAHVGVRPGVGARRRGPGAEDQGALVVGRVAARAAADRRAVRVGEAGWRVRAAWGEGRAVRPGLRPAVVAPQAVGLVGGLAALQVGQGGQQRGDPPGGGHVDRGAGGGVQVAPAVVSVRRLVGG